MENEYVVLLPLAFIKVVAGSEEEAKELITKKIGAPGLMWPINQSEDDYQEYVKKTGHKVINDEETLKNLFIEVKLV